MNWQMNCSDQMRWKEGLLVDIAVPLGREPLLWKGDIMSSLCNGTRYGRVEPTCTFSCICTCVRNGPWQFACGLFWASVIISAKIDIEASILEVKIDAQKGHIVRDTMMVAVQ